MTHTRNRSASLNAKQNSLNQQRPHLGLTALDLASAPMKSSPVDAATAFHAFTSKRDSLSSGHAPLLPVTTTNSISIPSTPTESELPPVSPAHPQSGPSHSPTGQIPQSPADYLGRYIHRPTPVTEARFGFQGYKMDVLNGEGSWRNPRKPKIIPTP